MARLVLGHLRWPGNRDGHRLLAHRRDDGHDVRRGALSRRGGQTGCRPAACGGFHKRRIWRGTMNAATAAPARNPRRETKHLTTAERIAVGRAARKQVPRFRHGLLELPADRPDPVALLERQAESRVPELVPIRYGRMLVSPFTF